MPQRVVVDRSSSFAKAHYVPHKDIFIERSPRSPLSTSQSPASSTLSGSLDLPIDDGVASIHHLYQNVCEMQSSDHSPSHRSFLSYGDESRIDSELRFFAGGEPNQQSKTINVAQQQAKKLPGKPPKGSKKALTKKTITPSIPIENGKDKDYLGPYLLKQAREMIASGDNSSEKALDLALRAMKSFECAPDSSHNLDFVMCMHVVSTLYCRLGRYSEAIPVLERSIKVPNLDLGPNHALAKFAGCMQLGDTHALLGEIENSILFYTAGLEIQRQVLGDNDPRFGETCRYLAEAHVQAIQFEEAESLVSTALDIHRINGKSGSPEEAADRRLLGLICESKGDYETALEYYVLAGVSMKANKKSDDVAAIDCSIGDCYLSLARYDEAIFAYQKALNTFKSIKGESHPSVASVLVRLADLYNKTGRLSESKTYCDNAIRIYLKRIPGNQNEEIAGGFVDISAIYEAMNEHKLALEMLQKAANLYGDAPGQQSIIAGIEAQMGVLHYILGSYKESYESLKKATTKFRGAGEKKSALYGIALNQMGLASVQLFMIKEAVGLFEEAREVLEAECGTFHVDTLGVYSNLAGAYDAMGRIYDAIDILEYVVDLREERLGTANPDVDDEKRRLGELLKEAGMVRRRKSRPLESLLDNHTITPLKHAITPLDIQGL